jgi:hypothetical protein
MPESGKKRGAAAQNGPAGGRQSAGARPAIAKNVIVEINSGERVWPRAKVVKVKKDGTFDVECDGEVMEDCELDAENFEWRYPQAAAAPPPSKRAVPRAAPPPGAARAGAGAAAKAPRAAEAAPAGAGAAAAKALKRGRRASGSAAAGAPAVAKKKTAAKAVAPAPAAAETAQTGPRGGGRVPRVNPVNGV